jgi:RES domain-containing protein
VRAKPWAGVAFRSVAPHHARVEDLLSGAGAARHGGRWNPPGIAAVYCSLTAAGALDEVVAYVELRGLAIVDAMPRVFVGLRIRLRRIVDLCDGRTRQRIRVSRQRMLTAAWRDAADEPVTQAIGRAVFDLGLEGLLVPSAASRRGSNIVIFPTNLRSTSSLVTEGIP